MEQNLIFSTYLNDPYAAEYSYCITTTQTATQKKSEEQRLSAQEALSNIDGPKTKLVLATSGIPHLPGWFALTCNVTPDPTFYRFNHKEVLITEKEDISPCINR